MKLVLILLLVALLGMMCCRRCMSAPSRQQRVAVAQDGTGIQIATQAPKGRSSSTRRKGKGGARYQGQLDEEDQETHVL